MSKPLLPTPLHAAGTLVGVSLLAAMACASANSAPITSDQFAPAWREHAQALVSEGPAPRDLSKTSWYVPAITPRGRYALVSVSGDKAQVIDGYQFEITNDAERDVHMIVPPGYADIEAVPVSDIPTLKLHGWAP